MAIRRSQNWINQQRVDIPHLRSIESAVRNDFDELLSALVLGEDQSYVLRGFEISMSGAIGSAASSLQLLVEEGSIFHGKSQEAGTFFVVPSGTAPEVLSSTTNEKIDGSFTPSALNYVGIEYTREIDDSTTAQLFLWNPTVKNEISKTAPLAVTFDYKIVITSSIYAANILPIAIVETDASNNVISVEDRRPMLFRQATAGSNTPDPYAQFDWADGRDENFYKSTTSTSPFQGGDKQIKTLKDWMDAVTTSIHEIKGTTYWYSEGAAGSIFKLRADLDRTQITGSGKISHDDVVAGQLNWDNDVFLNFVGSRLSYKIASNAATTDITLVDNQVAYIKIVRGVDIAPKLIFTQSSAIITSVGAVSWTTDVLADDWIKLKVENDTLYYQILSVDSASQITLSEPYLETSTGTAGTEAEYAYGTYQTDAAPSTDRHIKTADRRLVPFGDDYYWLFLRNDNGGAVAKVYMRGVSGGEIEQGESRQISDNTTDEVLEYIGSPTESDSTPDYTNAIAIYLPEITNITFPAGAALADGQAFEINSANNGNEYYAWANIDGGGSDPFVPGRIGIEVAISSAGTAIANGTAFSSAIDGIGDFNSVDNLDGSITVTNSQVGESEDAANIDMGAGFSITVSQQGVGRANCVLVDDENLTKGEKRLDEAICLLQDALDKDAYREIMDVVVGAPASSNEIQGPIAVGTIATLPLNSKNLNVQQQYEVEGCTLVVLLNGDRLITGRDYLEIGTAGDLATTIDLQRPMEVGDTLEFLLEEAGAGAGGGGSQASGTNLGAVADADVFKQLVGQQFQFRRLTAGSGTTITEGPDDINISVVPQVAPENVITIIADYVIQSTDNTILVLNSGTDISVTLPSATSSGRKLTIKKIGAANLMFVKSVGGQLFDNVDIDANPHQVNIQFESITLIADGTSWWQV